MCRSLSSRVVIDKLLASLTRAAKKIVRRYCIYNHAGASPQSFRLGKHGFRRDRCSGTLSLHGVGARQCRTRSRDVSSGFRSHGLQLIYLKGMVVGRLVESVARKGLRLQSDPLLLYELLGNRGRLTSKSKYWSTSKFPTRSEVIRIRTWVCRHYPSEKSFETAAKET